jgi:4-hydroxybenzoyl-CoA thioesterase
MLTNVRPVSIEWGMCDPAGIVFYPRYFEIFDGCLNALFKRATGLTKFEMLAKYAMTGYPSVDTRCKFIRPCKFGDEVTVESRIAAFRRSSFDVEHRLVQADGSLAVEGFDTRVWVGRDAEGALKSRALPDDLVAAFA